MADLLNLENKIKGVKSDEMEINKKRPKARLNRGRNESDESKMDIENDDEGEINNANSQSQNVKT